MMGRGGRPGSKLPRKQFVRKQFQPLFNQETSQHLNSRYNDQMYLIRMSKQELLFTHSFIRFPPTLEGRSNLLHLLNSKTLYLNQNTTEIWKAILSTPYLAIKKRWKFSVFFLWKRKYGRPRLVLALYLGSQPLPDHPSTTTRILKLVCQITTVQYTIQHVNNN